MIRVCALLLLSAAVAGQTGPGVSGARSPVMLERRIALQHAMLAMREWQDDSPGTARSWFEHPTRRNVPFAYGLPFAELAKARRVCGPQSGLPIAWQPLADALDLRCVPGVFAASEPDAKRQAITVHVTPLYGTPLPTEAFDLVLSWHGPNGEYEQARRESVEPGVVPAGFEMYVHAPTSAPGTWWLEPMIVRSEPTESGVPKPLHLPAGGNAVPVECVADLETRMPALEERDPAAARAVRALLETGVRDPLLPSIEALLSGDDPPRARPFVLDGFDCGEHELVAVEPEPTAEVQATLVAVAPPSERASWLFAGPAFVPWREFAGAERVRILSTDLPVHDADGPDSCALIDALRAREPGRPILLLARGSVMSELAMALHSGVEPCFDALVQSSLLVSGVRPRALAPRPTLFVEVLAEHENGPELVESEGGPSFYHARTPGPPLFADLVLPSHIAAWLRTSAVKDEVSGH